MGKLSGTPFPGDPEGSRQWLLLSASLSTYYSIILLFQYFLLGFFLLFFVYFLPCFSSAMNVAYCSIQHTTFPIPHPVQITSSISSKTSLLSFSSWDLSLLLQHGLLPCLLAARASIIPLFPTGLWLKCLSDCPFMPIQLLLLLILPPGPNSHLLSPSEQCPHTYSFHYSLSQGSGKFLSRDVSQKVFSVTSMVMKEQL